MSAFPNLPFFRRSTGLWTPALRGLDDRDASPSYSPPPPGLTPLTLDEFRRTVSGLGSRVAHPDEGFFPRDGMVHKVFGNSAPLALGLTPIFYELAHYGVGFSIAKSGSFAKTPLWRGLRTYTFSSTVGYGSVEEASKMSEFLFRMHMGVKGQNPRPVPGLDVTTYQATDPASLLWVWATLMKSGLDGYEMFVEPLPPAKREEFYRESKTFGMLFGVPESLLPKDYEDFLAYFRAALQSPAMWVSPEAKETGRLLFANLPAPLRPYFIALTSATLTPELRDAFGLPWDKSVAKRADRFILAVRAAYALAPDRIAESPMKGVLRARVGQGDSADEVLRALLDFAFAVGTQSDANSHRPVPLSKWDVLAKSLRSARGRVGR